MLGGLSAGLAGQDAQAGATAAQNEALNNDGGSDQHTKDAVQNGGLGFVALTTLYTLMPWLPGNPVAQAAGSAVGSIVQGMAGQIQSHGGGNPPSTGAAPVTACDPPVCTVMPAPTGAPGNALLSKGGDNGESELEGNSGGTSTAQAPAPNESADGVPGRVQSRINVTSDGMAHIGDRHLDSTVNASQFTISEGELTTLLQDPKTVSAPVTRALPTDGGLNYVREVDTGRVIGTDKFNNYQPTSTMTVITDKYGNLVTAFPGKWK